MLNLSQDLDASCPIEERIEANIELMHLGEDFVHASRTVGKIIISEVREEEERRREREEKEEREI